MINNNLIEINVQLYFLFFIYIMFCFFLCYISYMSHTQALLINFINWKVGRDDDTTLSFNIYFRIYCYYRAISLIN